MFELQCLTHLAFYCLTVLFLLFLPRTLSLCCFDFPLQPLPFAFLGFLYAKPIHEWMISAKPDRISAHFNRQRRSATNCAND